MKPEIRSYSIADKQNCLEAFKSNVPLFFTAAEIADFEIFLDRLEQLNFEETEERVYYYVVLVNGKITGCGGFGFYNPTENIRLIWGLVHKDHHKTGLGEQLLLHRLEEIVTLHPEKSVEIDTTQHSYGFFEKYGFVTTKIMPDYYTAGLDRYDMVLEKPNR